MAFIDRVDAGIRLAARLRHLAGTDLVVLALPRGGVPVALEIAAALHAPLDVIVVRKLGLPGQPELAMGAIGEGGVEVRNEAVLREARVPPAQLAAVRRAAQADLDRRLAWLRGGRPGVALAGRTAVVVDDGVATGSTALAACRIARARGAARVVLAVPVLPADALPALGRAADEVVYLDAPPVLRSVSSWYEHFPQVDDSVVAAALGGLPVPLADAEVSVPAGDVSLPGSLTVPDRATGLVVFAHGSGSSRHSPRNRYVAMLLNRAGLGTLLLDLLTPAEEANRGNVFAIELLAARLGRTVDWLRTRPAGRSAAIGLFGASTGAAAALWAAAEPGAGIAAVVSRGGRPDLAAARLPLVHAPTLLIVGGRDGVVLNLNRAAQSRLGGVNRLTVVSGAGHLFEEPGALATVARLATDWFVQYLRPPAADRPAPAGDPAPAGRPDRIRSRPGHVPDRPSGRTGPGRR